MSNSFLDESVKLCYKTNKNSTIVVDVGNSEISGVVIKVSIQ